MSRFHCNFNWDGWIQRFISYALSEPPVCTTDNPQKGGAASSIKAPMRFELMISCLLDRRFNQLSHGASQNAFSKLTPSSERGQLHLEELHVITNLVIALLRQNVASHNVYVTKRNCY
jgi:hypothetical protein